MPTWKKRNPGFSYLDFFRRRSTAKRPGERRKDTYPLGCSLEEDLLLCRGSSLLRLGGSRGLLELVELVACLNLDKVARLDALLDGLDKCGLVDVDVVLGLYMLGNSLD